MDKVRFAYSMIGTEAIGASHSEYITPHSENLLGEVLDECRDPVSDLQDLTDFEKIAQAKLWRARARDALTKCEDAVLVAELCGDKESRAAACNEIVESIMSIVDYNIDYALDVLYRRCNVYSDCSPDFVRIRHGIDVQTNERAMSNVDTFINDLFDIAKKRADIAVKEKACVS
ncbi:MAG: hypothetical protein R8K20_11880 [Gallionellaceae bacterium]